MSQRSSRLVVSAAVLLSLHLALSHGYRNAVMGDGVAERTWAQFEELRDGIHTVALGDSHVKWGVATDAIPGSFNFALPGETYARSFYRLRSLLEEEGLAPRAVLLGADPHQLERRREPEPPFLHYYASFVDFGAIGAAEGEWLAGQVLTLRGRLAPYAGQRANVLAYLATGLPPEMPWLHRVPMRAGGVSSELVLTRFGPAARLSKAEQRIRFHFGPEPAVDPVLADYLARLLALCEAHGIRALLVRFPLSDEYLTALHAVVDPGAMDAHVEALLARHPSATLLDARELFAGQLRLFADVDHLNRTGAERLARRIAAALAR